MNPMDEKTLIARAQSGDFDAFAELTGRERERIYRLALKLTGNQQDAEDVLQDTFFKAIEQIEKFRMEASFGTWLYTIALNRIRKIMSNRKRTDPKPIEDYLPDNHDTAGALFDWGDPHSIMENKELNNIIDTALAEMPQLYSAPFVLRYVEDLSIKEVAETLKLTTAATKSRILRARLALRATITNSLKERHSERV